MKILLTLFVLFFSSSISANEVINISETSWKFTDGDGSIALYKFHYDFKCSYAVVKNDTGNEGKVYSKEESNCVWQQNENVFTLNHNNNFLVRIGVIDGSNIKGFYVSNRDNGYLDTFTAKRNF